MTGSSLDFNKLKAQALTSGEDEEAVTVNTRALIDKVLARYSGEWTVLRELLQNAADASASKVSIKFETIPSPDVPVPQSAETSDLIKHVLMHHTVQRLVVSNNGHPFLPDDWSRLKRIAEGNPDETKIGAFGVGFYSVFADCEEPFVSSGNEALAFYWKGNSLFTRSLKLLEEDCSSDTNFVLDYRNTTSSIPGLLRLCQFLASSLTFISLETLELWIDNWKIFSLQKKAAPSVEVSIPRNIRTTTAEGLMKVVGASHEIAQLDASWMKIVDWTPKSQNPSNPIFGGQSNHSTPSLRSFFARLTLGSSHTTEVTKKDQQSDIPAAKEDLAEISVATVFLHTTTASLKTSVNSTFKRELERATKKPPPKFTKVALLTSSFGENEDSAAKSSIFAKVLPSKAGKVFIGFPTQQTTGIKAHISAPSLIPTVERENIDLNARWVSTWNIELLRAIGIVCRITWSVEMTKIAHKLDGLRASHEKQKLNNDMIESVIPETLHILDLFNFEESTPLPQISHKFEEAFWTSNEDAWIDLLSTNGVLPSYEIRIAPDDMSFIDGIPFLPEKLRQGARSFISKLLDFGLLTEVSVSDIKKSLEKKVLNADQLEEFLKWICRKSSSKQLDRSTIRSLCDVAIAEFGTGKTGATQLLMVGKMSYYIKPSRIPPDLPIPPDTLPFRYTKSLPDYELQNIGLEELGLLPWLQWLLEIPANQLGPESDMTKNPEFAKQVLCVLSKQWELLSASSKASAVEALCSRTVISTRLGMRRPSESYFTSVKLFNDLPIICNLPGVKEKFLTALGVRKTIELGVIFERLLRAPENSKEDANGSPDSPKWSHVDLIHYLASVKDDIPKADIERLRRTPICPIESEDANATEHHRLFVVGELFMPKDALRSLRLPILQWPGTLRPSSAEAKFMISLGLKERPSAKELVEIVAKAAANHDIQFRDHALSYFILKFSENGYDKVDMTQVNTAFLPVEGSKDVAAPSRVFTTEGAKLLGFNLLSKNLYSHAQKFGVKPDPPMDECIHRLLKTPPSNFKTAKATFSYFSGRLAEIHATHIMRLANARIVPISRALQNKKNDSEGTNPRTILVSPTECFLGESDVYGEIFDFVDFGQEANSFLLKCGSKHEPSRLEIARMVVKEPAKVYATFKSTDRYLDLLRRLSESLPDIKKQKDLYRAMKSSKFLLASKEVSANTGQSKAKTLKKTGVQTNEKTNENVDLAEEDDEEGAPILEWQLVRAQDAIIEDDYMSYQLFRGQLLTAPQEDSLERFYATLGTPYLSDIVQESAIVGNPTPNQDDSVRLKKRVLERLRLFLHGYAADSIKHAVTWLESNLSFQSVEGITVQRTLITTRLTQKESRTAAILRSKNKTHWILYATRPPDMYQVSQALVKILLRKPTEHSALTLESLLTTDLRKLSARGYNVSRILRRREAENRVAEEMLRQEQRNEELKKNEEQQILRQTNEASGQPTQVLDTSQMPGTFFDDLQDGKSETIDSTGVNPESRRGVKSLFQNLTKKFNLEGNRTASEQIQSLLGNNGASNQQNNDKAFPSEPYTPQHDEQQGDKNTDSIVTRPHQLHENLVSAIKRSRPHGSSGLYARGETNIVKETRSYCDERPASDISFLAQTSPGIRVYVSNKISPEKRTEFFITNSLALDSFARILIKCAEIFALNEQSMHIFYDLDGDAIAFNSRGSIFCNYRFFNQLHISSVQQGEYTEALVYWWTTICHELAHNLVGDHNSAHSFYTEGFVQQYFNSAVNTMVQMRTVGNGAHV